MNVLHIAEAKIISAQRESHRFFTIGHSTRPISEFVDLLTPHKIKLVIDVRAVPRSRVNPQYHSTELAKVLSELRIDYRHISTLGGLRKKVELRQRKRMGSGKTKVSTTMLITR